ncbi:hypothetical protein XELAEV_18028203mg [Xenopus laevis]|nr:hypothetical protein XELAEV_18028203mg [Xenopus laevis]
MNAFHMILWLAYLFKQSSEQLTIVEYSELSTDLEDNQDLIVGIHNDYRRWVNPSAQNMLKLHWNNTLLAKAKEWAMTCNFNHSDDSYRLYNGVYAGENILNSYYPVSWYDVITDWFKEGEDWVYEVGSESVTGHFTQIIWAPTHSLACYCSECDGDSYHYFYVCIYFPAGNRKDDITTPYSSGAWCSKCPNDCDNQLCTNYCPYQDIIKNCKDVKDASLCGNPSLPCDATCICGSDKIY